MRVIPTQVHGFLDYIVGIALILAPNVFGFEDVGGMAVLLPRILGAATIAMALLTNYELGLIRVIPMRMHLMVDFAAGALLAVSPWLFGFSDQPLNAWLPHVVVGLGEIVAVILTQWTPTTLPSTPKPVH